MRPEGGDRRSPSEGCVGEPSELTLQRRTSSLENCEGSTVALQAVVANTTTSLIKWNE